MTIDQLLNAVLEGGLGVGVLVLLGFVVTKLPTTIERAITSALAPLVTTNQRMLETLERLEQADERQRLEAEIRSREAATAGTSYASAYPPFAPITYRGSGDGDGPDPASDDRGQTYRS